MAAALAAAQAAGRRGEVPVGAVVVRDGAIVAAEGNRMRELGDPTAHAEMLALRAALTQGGGGRLAGADLYVTLEPCAMCAAAISFCRIRRLYFGAADPKGGAVESGVRFFSAATCHHAPEVYGGIAAGDAGRLLRAFFAERRGGEAGPEPGGAKSEGRIRTARGASGGRRPRDCSGSSR